MAGEVLVNDQPVTKAGTPVEEDAPITLKAQLPFVGRGALKLEHALDTFHIDVRRTVALDVGASTGGFTDSLLQRGATRVYALDVGHGQLDYKLRVDNRVVVIEGVNARYSFHLAETVTLSVLDLSFISLTKVLPSTAEHMTPGSFIIPLIKPQFEAQREELGKGGVIRDPIVHQRVLTRFLLWVIEQGWTIRDITTSPVFGDSGNREFLALIQLPFTHQPTAT